MNQLRCTAAAIILITSLISCNYNSTNAQVTPQSPVEYGKQFTSVCKVGVKGGDGTLIDKNWVLTAGHVAEGMFNRTNGELSVYFENGSEYKVEHVFLHPKYQPMGKYDLALLKLGSKVDEIDPIQIYPQNDELNQLIIIAGHGDKRATDNSWIKDGKLRAYTNIIDGVNNTHIIFDYDSPENDPTEREGTSGPGDSGGPAFIHKGEILYLAGVSSMGEPGIKGPATYGAIEHFVRVSIFQDWINETIQNPDSTKAYSVGEIVAIEIGQPLQWSDSDQARYAKLIVTTLENYSRQKMIDAISESFDPVKLEKRPAEKIIEMMPALIRELQGAKLLTIRSESADKMSFEL
ncbi:MAG: trypsin-like serine protease, partial [Bacteroidia bacterium]|nr:trypsin-like serine protease [Bacteroidia bacterium]